MRFLKSFESNTDKNKVVDEVVADVGDFFQLFTDKLIKYKTYDDWEEKLEKLMYSDFDSFDYYQLYEYDMDGRYSYAKSKIIKAANELHAEVKYSIMLNNLEILTTGYYFTKKINKENVDKTIEDLEKSIKLSSEYLDYLKKL
jgi:hypothetical protein